MIHQNIVKVSQEWFRPAGANVIADAAIRPLPKLKPPPISLDNYVFSTSSKFFPNPCLWDMDYPERRKPKPTRLNFDALYTFSTASNTVPNASLWDIQNRPSKRTSSVPFLPDSPFISALKSSLWDIANRPAKRQFSPFVLPEAPIIAVTAPTLFLDAPLTVPSKIRTVIRSISSDTFTAIFKAWDVQNPPPVRHTPTIFALPDVRTFEPTTNPVFWDEEVRRPSKIAATPRVVDSWTFTRLNPSLWDRVPIARPAPRPIVALTHDTPILAIQSPYIPLDEALRPQTRIHALTIIWRDEPFISPPQPPPPPPAPCIPFRSDASLVYQTRGNSMSAVITRETVQMSDQSRTETTGSGQSRPESDPTDISRPNTKVKDCEND